MGYAALARLIEPAVIEPVIVADPDDDVVLACAAAPAQKRSCPEIATYLT
jgi:hypothetical protein